MTMPYREWTRLDRKEMTADGNPTLSSGWTTGGGDADLGEEDVNGVEYFYWHCMYRPKEVDKFQPLISMDEVANIELSHNVSTQENTNDFMTSVQIFHGIVKNAIPWIKDLASGRLFNGEDNWDAYPPGSGIVGAYTYDTLVISVVNASLNPWIVGYQTAVDTLANRYQNDFFRGGIKLYIANFDPGGPGVNEKIQLHVSPNYIRAKYFNAVVNSLSRWWSPVTGGVEVVLTGLGFNNSDADINENGPAHVWVDLVDYIYFIDVATMGSFTDEYDDDSRDSIWTDEVNNGSITEASEKLTLAVANGVDGNFWGASEGAPITTLDANTSYIIAETKITAFTDNDNTRVGMYITDTVGGNNGFSFTIHRSDHVVKHGIQVQEQGVGELAYVAETRLPLWLRIRAVGSPAGKLYFEYSLDGKTWEHIHTQTGVTWDLIGLFARNWGVFNAVSVDFEYFTYSYEGAPTATLTQAVGDFVVDSNTQITIPANKFPAMPTGSYAIKLRKDMSDVGLIDSYAGDWRSNSLGSCIEGGRFSFFMGNYIEEEYKGKGDPILLVEWTLKTKAGVLTTKYYSVLNIRAPNKFYEGRILDYSTLTRAIDNRTGLFKVADMTLRLSNNDLEFSKLLPKYIFKNQQVKLYIAYLDEPEGWKNHIATMIVEDCTLHGEVFEVELADITQKYFKKKVPRSLCESSEFPNIHPNFEGKPMPEVLGLAELDDTYENPGAVEAMYIDTTTFKYLAAAGSLKEIDEVFSAGILQATPGDYSVSYDVKGRTYITFTGDQGDKKITYNGKGYTFGGWDSTNDYVQNPAYIAAYYLAVILEVPFSLMDLSSFDVVATMYANMGADTGGKLILQNRAEAMEKYREILFSCGAKSWFSLDGRFKIGRKDISNFATNLIVFEQSDTLSTPRREFNLKDAINIVNAKWDYVPTWDLFKTAAKTVRENFFEEEMEDPIEKYREDLPV